MVKVYLKDGTVADVPSAESVESCIFIGETIGRTGVCCKDTEGNIVGMFASPHVVGYTNLETKNRTARVSSSHRS